MRKGYVIHDQYQVPQYQNWMREGDIEILS